MKRITAILILTFICQFNTSYSQTKTPYEKKVDQIMTEMCKAIGVENSLIQMAVKLNDWDIVRTSQDLAFKSKMLDRNELLVIVLATDQKLKDAEKLKNEVDDRKKKEKEAKEQQIKEEKLEKELARYSDLVEIKNEIFSEFSKWATKGEFETVSDFQIRMNIKEKVIDSIAFELVSKRITLLHGFYINDNKPAYYIELKNYDADKQLYHVLLARRNSYKGTNQHKDVIIKEELNVNVELAKLLKQNSEKVSYYDIPTKSHIDDYIVWFDDIQITYSKNLDNWIVNSNGFFFPKSYNILRKYNHNTKIFQTTLKEVKIHTNELDLRKYFPIDYVIDISTFLGKRLENERQVILIKADRLLSENKLEQAKNLLIEANNLRFTEEINNKIQALQIKIIEFKRNELIKSAEQYEKEGNLSNSIEKLEKANELFKEANNLTFNDNIQTKIVEIEDKLIEIKQNELIKTADKLQKVGFISNAIGKLEEAIKLKARADLITKIDLLKKDRDLALNNHKTLDSLFKLAQIGKLEIFKDIVTPSYLDEVKKGYGQKYIDCKSVITTNFNSLWTVISNTNSEINRDRNREVWNDNSKEFLNKINEFRNEIGKYSNFEINVHKALMEKDKKYLKIFKEDDVNSIIETIVSSN